LLEHPKHAKTRNVDWSSPTTIEQPLFWHNLRMPEGHQFSLQEADQRRGDFADQRPKLTKG
jgi:hypothetical protein